MWKIKRIYEGDYGCEERQPGDKIKCVVSLCNENGDIRQLQVEDEWLISNNLDEGSEWPQPVK